MFLNLVRPAALDRDAVVNDGQSHKHALAAAADHFRGVAGRPAAVQAGEEALPLDCALDSWQLVVDDLLLAVRAQAEDYQYRALDGTDPVAKHDTAEHQGLVAVGQRTPMERRDRFAQGFGDPAHGGGRDRAPERGQHHLADLPGRPLQHEASQDGPIDLREPAGVALEHHGQAVADARHRDVANSLRK